MPWPRVSLPRSRKSSSTDVAGPIAWTFVTPSSNTSRSFTTADGFTRRSATKRPPKSRATMLSLQRPSRCQRNRGKSRPSRTPPSSSRLPGFPSSCESLSAPLLLPSLFLFSSSVAALEEGPEGGGVAEHGEGVVGVAVRVAVADEEVDVLADAFGAQRGAGKARRHREEVDDAAVAGDEDGGHLGVRYVDARQRH